MMSKTNRMSERLLDAIDVNMHSRVDFEDIPEAIERIKTAAANAGRFKRTHESKPQLVVDEMLAIVEEAAGVFYAISRNEANL